jgi:hypothetical protein
MWEEQKSDERVVNTPATCHAKKIVLVVSIIAVTEQGTSVAD